MRKVLEYAFITCSLAYLLIAIPIFALFATSFRGLYEPIIDIRGMLGFLTLMLSDFSWWGSLYYLAAFVPWLSSCFIVSFLLHRFNGRIRTRVLLSGFGVFLYYFVMWLVFIIHGLIYGWGDVAYEYIWVWPVCGFVLGCAAALIVENILHSD